MNVLLSVVLLLSICSIKADGEAEVDGAQCENLGGKCVSSMSKCQSVMHTVMCPDGNKCCRTRKARAAEKTDSRRICKKTPKKCKRKGGVCTHYEEECKELIDENLCKGHSCRCCKASKCKIKKACKKKGGKCVTDPKDCMGSLGKGCKGKGCQCCVPTVKCGIETTASSRIVGGDDVSVPRKYSWQVGLKRSKAETERYYCGGSIITNKHILTAAHCFYEMGTCVEDLTTPVYVGIGDHKQEDTTDNLPDFVKPILAKQITINPNFVCATSEMDVAVIELDKPIDLLKNSEVLHPICLPKADDSKSYAGVTATASGWGSILAVDPGEFATNFPNVLQEVQLSVLDNSECLATFTDNMLCTSTTGGKDACIGDAGGPVTLQENGQYVQIGIVSFGLGCASEGNFGGHTRVNKVLDWVKEQVGSEKTYTLP